MARHSLLLLSIAAAQIAIAQPIYLARPDGTRIALESGTAKLVTNPKLFYFGGSSGGWAVDGKRSALRLSAADGQTFVTGPQGMQLVRLEPMHKRREWVQFNFIVAPFYGSGNTGPADIQLIVRRTDNGEVEVAPKAPLAPGEYAFLAVQQSRRTKEIAAYSFGIDDSPNAVATAKQPAAYKYRCIVFFCSHN